MSTVAEIVSALAEVTHPENAAPWDPVGLQLGDPESTVTSVGVCHEVTEAVVTALETEPVDLLISYHPLIFDPITAVVAGRSAAGRAHRLVGAGIGLLVAHTDFDSIPGGAADALADALSLRETTPFGDDEPPMGPSIGRVGIFDGSLSTLTETVSDRLGGRGMRVSGNLDDPVTKVAVVPGSGSDLVAAASRLSDVLVTGDVSHHRVVAALDLGLSIIDPGHIATERPGIRRLAAIVERIVDATVVDLTGYDPATW